MVNDYLWNKKGEDPEIELFEKQLRIFQYQELTPPRLPAKVSVVKPYFSFFSLRLAVGLSVIFGLLLYGATILITYDSKETAIINRSDLTPHPPTFNPVRVVQSKNDNDRIILPIKPEPQSKPQFINASQRVKRELPQKVRRTKNKIRLTAEEKYAYNQLMLALSITGSKLNEVKSKVNGGGEIPNEIKSIR